eukprot:jgi/Tetstr1/466072/TSEL_010658.t1
MGLRRARTQFLRRATSGLADYCTEQFMDGTTGEAAVAVTSAFLIKLSEESRLLVAELSGTAKLVEQKVMEHLQTHAVMEMAWSAKVGSDPQQREEAAVKMRDAAEKVALNLRLMDCNAIINQTMHTVMFHFPMEVLSSGVFCEGLESMGTVQRVTPIALGAFNFR